MSRPDATTRASKPSLAAHVKRERSPGPLGKGGKTDPGFVPFIKSEPDAGSNNVSGEKNRRSKVTNKSHSIFLESTYQMIEKSPPNVACWSESGDTFIVKDPAVFAKTMIPMFFKHSKFSSFVRQLNFYGFRKLKVDDLLLPQEEKTWWEFQHDKFIRGRKELLKDIRRKTCTGVDALNQMDREMANLKSEVMDLKDDMQQMKGTLDHLSNLLMKLTSGVPPPPSAQPPTVSPTPREQSAERPSSAATPSGRPSSPVENDRKRSLEWTAMADRPSAAQKRPHISQESLMSDFDSRTPTLLEEPVSPIINGDENYKNDLISLSPLRVSSSDDDENYGHKGNFFSQAEYEGLDNGIFSSGELMKPPSADGSLSLGDSGDLGPFYWDSSSPVETGLSPKVSADVAPADAKAKSIAVPTQDVARVDGVKSKTEQVETLVKALVEVLQKKNSPSVTEAESSKACGSSSSSKSVPLARRPSISKSTVSAHHVPAGVQEEQVRKALASAGYPILHGKDSSTSADASKVGTSTPADANNADTQKAILALLSTILPTIAELTKANGSGNQSLFSPSSFIAAN